MEKGIENEGLTCCAGEPHVVVVSLFIQIERG